MRRSVTPIELVFRTDPEGVAHVDHSACKEFPGAVADG